LSWKTGQQHGRDHDPDGQDPIPALDGFLRFDYDNEGGYLLVVANNHIPADDSSIRMEAKLDDAEEGGDFEVIARNILFLQGDSEVEVSSTGPIVMSAGTSPVTLSVNGQTFSFKDDGTIVLPSGAVIGP